MTARLAVFVFAAFASAPAVTPAAAAGKETVPAIGEPALTLRVPGRDWTFTMAPRGVEFGEPVRVGVGRIWVDGDGVDEPRFTVTVLIDEKPAAGSAEGCRSAALDSRLHREHRARLSTFGGMALAEYDIESYRGEVVGQRRVHGFLYRDGVCIDVGLSMLAYDAVHEPLFVAALRSVRLQEPRDGAAGP